MVNVLSCYRELGIGKRQSKQIKGEWNSSQSKRAFSGQLLEWRRGMELNHQIRLCRPFPFLFGFRAIFDNLSNKYSNNLFNRALHSTRNNSEPRSSWFESHQIPPPKEVIKASRKDRGLVEG